MAVSSGIPFSFTVFEIDTSFNVHGKAWHELFWGAILALFAEDDHEVDEYRIQ